MENMKLSKIFESVVNDTLNLSSYPNLLKVVNLFKSLKKNGEFIIKPDDFTSLLEKSDPYTQQVLLLLNRKEFSKEYNNRYPQGRVYNFIKGLNKEIISKSSGKPQEIKLYTDALHEFNFNLLDDINGHVPTMNIPSPDDDEETTRPAVGTNNIMKIEDTTYLKNNAVVVIDDVDYHVTDETLSIFDNYERTPNVLKYHDAIYGNNLSLPDDVSSDEGLVYTLFKKLTNSCTMLITSVSNLQDKMSYLDKKGTGGALTQHVFIKTPVISFSQLHDRVSKVKFIYNLYNSDGSMYGNKLINYNGTFTYSSLTHKHRFINDVIRSNDFYFYKNNNRSIETGQKYRITYTSDNIPEREMIINIISMELSSGNKESNYSTLTPCGSLDELIEILESITNMDN